MENTMREPNSPLTDKEKQELLALGIDQFIVDNTQRDTYDYIMIAQHDVAEESRQQRIGHIVERAKALIVRDYIKSHLSEKRCKELRAEIDNEMGKSNPTFIEDYITDYENKWTTAWEQNDNETLFKIAYALGAIAMNNKRTELLLAKYEDTKTQVTKQQQKKAQVAALTSSRDGTIQLTKSNIARDYIESMIPEEIQKALNKKYHDISEKNDVQPPDDYEAQWNTASKNRDYETLFGLAYLLEDANWHTELGELLEREYDIIQAQRAQQDKEAERLYEKVATKQTIETFPSLRFYYPQYEQQINAAEEYIRSYGYGYALDLGFGKGFTANEQIIFNGKEGAIIVPNARLIRAHGDLIKKGEGYTMWKFSIDNPAGIEPFNDKRYKTTQDGGILCKSFIEAQHIASEILPLKEIVRPISFDTIETDPQDLTPLEQHEVEQFLLRDSSSEYIAAHTTRTEYNRLIEERDRHDLPPTVVDIITNEVKDSIVARIERNRDRLTNISKSMTIDHEGDHNESTKPRAVSGSEGEDHSQSTGRGSNTGDVQERQGGANSQVGGVDGRGYGGDGHRDDIPGRATPSDNTVPSGRVSVSELDDRAASVAVRKDDMPQGGVEGQLQEPTSSVQQSIDGDGLDFADLATVRQSTAAIQTIAYTSFRAKHPEWTKQLDDAEEHIKTHGCQMPAEIIVKGDVGIIIAATEDATAYKAWGFSPNAHTATLPINGKDNVTMKTWGSIETFVKVLLSPEPWAKEKKVDSPLTRSQIASIREQCRQILQKDDSDITDDDKAILSQYEGGGGIKQEKDRSVDAVLNEFYTPRNVINKVWGLVDYYVPDAETILEPSSGIGRFAEGRMQNKVTLRELDATSARIAQLLHPDAEVIQGAFQAQFFDSNGIARKKDFVLPKYDVVIGNPPYGAYTNEWKGKGEGAEHTRQEEYFIDRGVDSLNDNGVMAFVVPSGFLRNASNGKLKERLGERAELIDAWRLPNGTFGTTDVGTDIIVMRRHFDVADKAKDYAARMVGDAFFKENPNHILGEEKTRIGRFGEEKYVALPEGKTIDDMLFNITPGVYDSGISLHETISAVQQHNDAAEAKPIEKELSNIEKIALWENGMLGGRGNTLFLSDGQGVPDTVVDCLPDKKVTYDCNAILASSNASDYNDIRREYNLHIYLDPDTGESLFMYKNTLVAHANRYGNVTYDWTESKGITKARVNRMNEIMTEYKETVALLAHSYMGCQYTTNSDNITTAQLWLRDTGANGTSRILRNMRIIDKANETWHDINSGYPVIHAAIGIETAIGCTQNLLVAEKQISEDVEAFCEPTEYNGGIKVFYAIPDVLYPKEGRPDFNAVRECDKRIREAWQAKVKDFKLPYETIEYNDPNWYEKRKEQQAAEYKRDAIAMEVLLDASGMTLEEYEAVAREAVDRDITLLKKTRADIAEMNLIERDNAPFCDALRNAESWEPGVKIQTNLGDVIIMDEGKDPGTIAFYLNGNKIIAINEGRAELKTFNNFPVTRAFYNTVRHQCNSAYGGDVDMKVSDEKWKYRRVSLSEKLTAKNVDTAKTQTGRELVQAVLSPDGYEKKGNSTLPQKTITVNGTEITAVQDGTYIRATFKGDNYAAFEMDTRIRALFIYQSAFDSGIWQGVESGVKDMWHEADITKEVTLGGVNYSDHNGETVTINQIYKPYRPELERLQNTDNFMSRYGKNWDKGEKAFWQATDWSGHVDTERLSDKERDALYASKNYVEDTPGHYIHKELFTSGDIYEKIDMLDREHVIGTFTSNEKLYENNRKLLLSARPKRLTAAEISISVTTSFAHDGAYGKPLTEQFLSWATGMNTEDTENTRDSIVDWTVAGISRDDIPPSISWGDVAACIDRIPVPRINAFDLDTAEKTRIRMQKINDRRETAERLFTRFTQTVLQGKEKEQFEDRWNKVYNAFRTPNYSALPLFIDGMNEYRKGREFKLYEQQIKGVSFLCNKGNGLLAYDVGVGKTACGVVTAVAQIQSGRAIRPLIIVPQQVLGKWESDIHELFPRIRVNNLGNFNKQALGAFYDGGHGLNIPPRSITVASKEALNAIVFDKGTIDSELFDDFARMLNREEDLASEDAKTRVEAQQEIYEKAGVANKARTADYIYWERTGFDSVIVDEAHAYKNLIRVPRPSQTTRDEARKEAREEKKRRKQSGVNTLDDEASKEKAAIANEFAGLGGGEPALRALKMFAITQLIQRNNNGRNVFMLTATPFTNSPLEIYSMLMYVARSEMEREGITNAYAFCSEYAKTRLEIAVAANGTVKEKAVMKEFNNPHGLQRILSQYIDKVDADEAGVIRPDKRVHKVYLEPTELQKEIFEFVTTRVMEFSRTDENGNPKDAPMLRGISMMRIASVSPALLTEDMLLDPETGKPSGIMVPPLDEMVDCSPKLKLVCDTVAAAWKARPNCGQVIYLPIGTEAYKHVVDYLVRQGVSLKAIATIDGQKCTNGGKTVKGSDVPPREMVSASFNDKKDPCKIIIGSAAMSEGMDLNGNSIALYNCLLGWTPSESEQVEGRIWRQGNAQGTVHIVYPLVEDSGDPFMLQKHDEKKHRTDEIFSYKGTKPLDVSDINPEELKFALITNPVECARLGLMDKQQEYINKSLSYAHQVNDFTALIESRDKTKARIEAREESRETYNRTYVMGKSGRTAEQQKEGLARFEKSIRENNDILRNIARKLDSMGIKTSADEATFVSNAMAKSEEYDRKAKDIMSESNIEAAAEKIKRDRAAERAAHAASKEARSLSDVILSDLVPFHVTEKRVKTERYNKAMESATAEEKKTLTAQYNEYLAQYKADWEAGAKDAPIVEHPKVVDAPEQVPLKMPRQDAAVTKQNTTSNVAEKTTGTVNTVNSMNAVNIVQIIGIASEKLENKWQAKNGPAQMTLFDFDARPSPAKQMTANMSAPYKKVMDTTVSNFQSRLQKLCKGKEDNEHMVVTATHALLNTMTKNEQEKFNKRFMSIGGNDKAASLDVLSKILHGTITFNEQQLRSAASLTAKSAMLPRLVHDKRQKDGCRSKDGRRMYERE